MTDDEAGTWAAIAEAQRAYFRELAARVERAEPISAELDRRLVAGALRAFAEQIPLKPKRGRGAAPKFNHWDAASQFYVLRIGHSLSANKAMEEVALRFGVTVEAIKNAVSSADGKRARSLFDGLSLTKSNSPD